MFIYSAGFLLVFACVACSAGVSAAQDQVQAGVYSDKNGYYSFVPPAGWTMEDFTRGYRSSVVFVSPDGAAKILIMAELDSGDLGALFLSKKELSRANKQRDPNGTFAARTTTIGGFKAVEMDYEVPGLTKKEFYYFFFRGMRFDLTYSASNEQDFQRFKDAALVSFSSIKPAGAAP